MEKATFAGGCFWCTETLFKQLKGVKEVLPGYSGGSEKTAKSLLISAGVTKHAEAVNITFDPKVISYKDLLYVFLRIHDPTQLNRQGVDVGTQYRSEIFYRDEKQKQEAEEAIAEAQKEHDDKIVTKVSKFKSFHKAEEHHIDFYKKNKGGTYCTLVIDPKIEKLKKDLGKYVKN